MAHERQRRAFPKQTTLTLAVAAALVNMAPAVATADTTISTPTTANQTWVGANFTVGSAGSIITSGGTALSGAVAGGTLTNSGTITGGSAGYSGQGGTISALVNNTRGVISAVGNTGLIGVSAPFVPVGFPPVFSYTGPGMPGGPGGNAIGIADVSATTLTNNGTISGTGGTGGIGGQGAPTGYAGNGGNGYGIQTPYSGLISSLTNTGVINGTGGNGGGGGGSGGGGYGIDNRGTIGTLNNNLGTISGTGGSGPAGTGTGVAIYNEATGNIGSLTNSGNISGGGTGIYNSYGGSIGTLSNSGTIGTGSSGISNSGTITTLNNNVGGTIIGSVTGIFNNGGSIGALSNSGTIGTGNYGISNSGTITTLNNNVGGTIIGSGTGIHNNGGSIGALSNSGTIGTGGYGISNNGTITTVNNNVGGTIIGSVTGIANNGGSIGTLTNAGVISGARSSGIWNTSSIGALTNSGTITGGTGISNSGTITTLTNTAGGTITGHYGIGNYNTMSALTNNGTISGSQYALYNRGTLGVVTNAGVIAGIIQNATAQDLTINGGTGSTFGTLTGFTGGTIGGVGTITNTSSNVVFGAGNVLLNDSINVGRNAVNNTGATLQVNAPMTITGNYNQSAGATLQVGVGSGAVTNGVLADTGYGRLVVSGTAVIASGSSISLTNTGGYAFAAGQRFVVVDAATSQSVPPVVTPLTVTTTTTNYNQGSLNYGIRGYNAVLTGANVTNGSRSDLVVTVVSASPILPPAPTPAPTPAPAPAPTTTPATIPNSIAALTGLSNYTGISDANLLNLFNAGQALNVGSSTDANRAGAQLSPVQSASATDGVAAPIFDVLSVMEAHANGLRLAKADRSATGIATGESPRDVSVWGQGFGGHANQSARDQVDGYGATYGGLMIGADKGIGDAWRAGGVFSYSNTLVTGRDNSSGDSTRVNGYGLTGYANYTGAPWYVNLSGSVVQQRYNTNREVSFTGFSGIANGSFSGQQYVARAEGGYPLAVGNITVTPLGSLTYSHLNQNSYTETGGNGAALAVGATHATSLRSSVGAKLEQGFETAYGKLVPLVQLQWVHEFNHNPAVTSASFAADPSGQTAFTTVGITPVSNLADLTLGVTLLRANNLSLSARYELQLAKGFVSQTGSLRLQQRF